MPSNLTTEDLDRLQAHYEGLRALEQRATPGPWMSGMAEDRLHRSALFNTSRVDGLPERYLGTLYAWNREENAEVAAAARNEFPGHVEMMLRMIARVRHCPSCVGRGQVNEETVRAFALGLPRPEKELVAMPCMRCRTDREELSIALAGLERAGRIKV